MILLIIAVTTIPMLILASTILLAKTIYGKSK